MMLQYPSLLPRTQFGVSCRDNSLIISWLCLKFEVAHVAWFRWFSMFQLEFTCKGLWISCGRYGRYGRSLTLKPSRTKLQMGKFRQRVEQTRRGGFPEVCHFDVEHDEDMFPKGIRNRRFIGKRNHQNWTIPISKKTMNMHPIV